MIKPYKKLKYFCFISNLLDLAFGLTESDELKKVANNLRIKEGQILVIRECICRNSFCY